MSTFLDKLNLRPQEQRWVVAVIVVVIVILNYIFVWPYFTEWGKVKTKMEETQKNKALYESEILMDVNPTNGYKAQLAKLEQTGGSPQLEGDIQLYKAILAQANGKIIITDARPVASHSAQTNEFYEEQSMRIDVDSNEKELVDFIFGIGGDSSMIRVRELNLRPADVNRYRLKGTITLSANYQKKTETKPAPAPAKAAVVTKPAPAPAKAAVATRPSPAPAPQKTAK